MKLSLADFAVLAAQERNDVTFAHFCDAAEQFLGRFVAITQPPIAGEEQSRQLLCHWISSNHILSRLATIGFDPGNSNPSRYERLAGAQRIIGARDGANIQQLLYLAPNPKPRGIFS